MSKWKDMKNDKHKNNENDDFQNLEEFEEAIKKETDDISDKFRERMQKENKRFFDVCNAHHYFTVCFSNEEQLFEFCEEFGIDPHYWFYDGREIAKKFHKALKTPDFVNPNFSPTSKDYLDRARNFGE